MQGHAQTRHQSKAIFYIKTNPREKTYQVLKSSKSRSKKVSSTRQPQQQQITRWMAEIASKDSGNSNCNVNKNTKWTNAEPWNEEIGGNNGGTSERRKMIENCWKTIETLSKKDGKQPRTSPEQTATEAQQVWNEEIGGKHEGISDRRKIIKSSDER